MSKVKNGDVLRIRYLTHADANGRTQQGYRPPEESNKQEDKQVYVVLLLGTEPLTITDNLNTGKELDVHSALRKLGYYSENGEDEEEISRLKQQETVKKKGSPKLKIVKKSKHEQ
jgi:hypothetical protein